MSAPTPVTMSVITSESSSIRYWKASSSSPAAIQVKKRASSGSPS